MSVSRIATACVAMTCDATNPKTVISTIVIANPAPGHGRPSQLSIVANAV